MVGRPTELRESSLDSLAQVERSPDLRMGGDQPERFVKERLARLDPVPRRSTARMGQADHVRVDAVVRHPPRDADDLGKRPSVTEHLLDRQRSDRQD